MKKYLDKQLQSVYFDDTLDGITEMIEQFKIKYKDYDNLRIVEETAYDGGYYHNLHGTKMESDEDYQARIKWNKEKDDTEKAYRRKQYEALKAEFENNK